MMSEGLSALARASASVPEPATFTSIPGLLQVHGDERGDAGFVFDDQNERVNLRLLGHVHRPYGVREPGRSTRQE